MLANVAEAASAESGRGRDIRCWRCGRRSKILLVVVTADRGLAGGFNANLIKLAQRFANEHKDAELSFELIGRKGRDYFRKRDREYPGEHLDMLRTLNFEDAEKIADAIIDRFSKGEIDAVYLFVNEFKSVMAPKLSADAAAAD